MMRSKPMVTNNLASWRELFRIPRTRDNECGITRKKLIEKALRDVADFELRGGESVIEVIHRRISKYLDIDYCDENEYVWNEIKNGDFKEVTVPDPFLRRTLGREMAEWVRTESGLMDFMSFRILLGSRVSAFQEVVGDIFSPYDSENRCSDLSKKWEAYKYDRLKTVALSEYCIMDMLIIPLFMSCREEFARKVNAYIVLGGEMR